ncbi:MULTISPECIES: DUF4194 domain-containing protein [Williamsia]|uniref:Uncharacterized protein DUF4194 n=1 Tax=Williamsia marianensis TaxID=85044 RepID=A0A495K981_WILMA|nr:MULTISPECIES: DUF4194 domain-containing protein [Williamsia]MCK0516452.1 DUF4194 domain-containing protein [Williamsia sp. DF01-3]PZU04376.1 MAG: DUF4194 domain-containing protein [Gordonia sp. (in: high G+C Gram-positive bacteria)]RKR97827.1 uncharacterized protein DUF4194 [Williamsia muralis]
MSTPEDDVVVQEGDDLFVDSPEAISEPSVDLSHFAFDGSEPVGTISEARIDARFDGDTSALPAPVCYALQELVAAAHVSARSRNWKTIEVHEEIIRSRLSELNLQLEINREHKYAFTRQVSENDPRQRNILRAQTLTLAASVLALFLRQKYLTSADESVVTERGEIIDHMLTYKPVSDTDEAGFIKRIDAAINQLESRKIIRALPGTDRFVVHGVIASLLGPEQVAAYTEAYRRLAGEHTEEGTDLTELDDQERTS